MPGYLGGSGSGGGVGGEIRFPTEFIDPVTKLRVSNPENLIDTDFEYGLQPTKWETLELINNTPSFFSKSGDTTIDGIVSITTNAGTREIIVQTRLEHGLAVGIPINVNGTKSLTADGAYIINSIPDPFTFTYLCKDNQPTTAAIQDLYTSIITGEFFQGSQLRISDENGITTDGSGLSVLTVTTNTTHGFGLNTPFYFLNLNSAIAQEFQASNTAAKSFDASNSATAQVFDGSNTFSSINIDFSNSAVSGGTVSNVTSANTIDETITVSHTTETFANLPLGTPLYYDVVAGSGFFAANPRGVVFLKSTGGLGATTSTFQVSETPDGPAINITGAITGTFQIANQAKTFAGNNRNPLTEIALTVVKEAEKIFDGGNQGYDGSLSPETAPNGTCTVLGYTGDSILVSTPGAASLNFYAGAMVRYTSSGAAATNLANNTTYFINSVTASATPGLFTLTIKALPNSATILSPSGGSGTQTFTRIGVSLDKDIFHIKDANFQKGDMLEYSAFPENGRVDTQEADRQFYFVDTAYDAHNYKLSDTLYTPTNATGGTISTIEVAGATYRVHTFTSTGTSTFEVSSLGTDPSIEYLVVGGGGGGGNDMGGGGGAGGYLEGKITLTATGNYTVAVGAGGNGAPAGTDGPRGSNGGNSSITGPGSVSIIAFGGGGGASDHDTANFPAGSGGSGGGGSGGYNNNSGSGYGGGRSGQGTPGQGFDGAGGYRCEWCPGGGGGASQAGFNTAGNPKGGDGKASNILGTTYWFAGGGGGSGYSFRGGDGGRGGGGGGAVGTTSGGANSINPASGGGGGGTVTWANTPGGRAATNSGGGGGGGAHYNAGNPGGAGGSGIVVIRYPITPIVPVAQVASGGTTTDITVSGTTYRIHTFSTTGTSNFTVTTAGNLGPTEYLIIAGGGGGGGGYQGGGGGAGGMLEGTLNLTAGTYPIVVGAGGRGSTFGSRAQSGQNSSAFGITTTGGGNGSSEMQIYGDETNINASPGGSGGGTGHPVYQSAQPGIPGQGNAGGTGPNCCASSGGGGAGGVGGNAGSSSSSGGVGGVGRQSAITGTSVFYAGGGAGCVRDSGTVYAGGNGGGGNGRGANQGAFAGADGFGGGGGGGGGGTGAGGRGGNGIVIVRYPIAIAGLG